MPSPSQLHSLEMKDLNFSRKKLFPFKKFCRHELSHAIFLTLARKTERTLNPDDFYPHGRFIPIAQDVFKNSEIEACYGDVVCVDRKDGSSVLKCGGTASQLSTIRSLLSIITRLD
jgi:hypothetical protein